MAKKILACVCLAAAALGTVWVVGGLATVVENNLVRKDSPLRLAGINFTRLIAVLIGIAILILIGRFLLGMSRVWLKTYGGFLACLGLFIGIVHTTFPISLRIDIQAFLSVQAYTAWIAAAFFVIGGLLFLSIKK
jgi:hypothetical protein